MKRSITLAFVLMLTTAAFAQKKSVDPLVSERNYKHPFAAAAARTNNAEQTEQFGSTTVQEASDYKHPKAKRHVKRVHIRQGSGANAAASHKHPFGL